MKVILSEDVDNLGEMGKTVNVARGYARNYLFPRKLAVQAESASAKQIEHELNIIKRRNEKRRAGLTEVATEIEELTVEIQVRAGENDRIFGSVTNSNIAEKLAEMGQDISRKAILLPEPIKALGIFTVPIKLGSGVEANIKVWVSAIAEETKAEETDDEAAETKESD